MNKKLLKWKKDSGAVKETKEKKERKKNLRREKMNAKKREKVMWKSKLNRCLKELKKGNK